MGTSDPPLPPTGTGAQAAELAFRSLEDAPPPPGEFVRATGRIARVVGGVGLVVAGLFQLIIHVVGPFAPGMAPQQALAAIAADPVGFRVEAYGAVLLPASAVPGLVAALGIPLRRGRNFVYVGATLTLIGFLGHAIAGMAPLAYLPLANSGLDPRVAATLVQPIWSLYFPVAVPLLLTIYVGLLLFIVGLWRGNWLPIWILVLYAIAFVLATSLGNLLSGPLDVVRTLPLVFVLGWIGILMVRAGLGGPLDSNDARSQTRNPSP